MKKVFLIVTFFLLNFFIFALDYNVCIYPSDSEIASYISQFFPRKEYDSYISEMLRKKESVKNEIKAGKNLSDAYLSEDKTKVASALKTYGSLKDKNKDSGDDFAVHIVNTSLSFDKELLIDGDTELLDYVCDSCSADLLIIPYKTSLSDLFHYQLYVYEKYNRSFELVYQYITQDSELFTIECVPYLRKFFTKEEVVVDSADNKEVRPVYSNLLVESDPTADLYVGGKLLGTTPYVIEEYSLPLILKFVSEGYEDKVICVSEPADSVYAELLMFDGENKTNYIESRDKFYSSFGIFLLSFGLRSAVMSFVPDNSQYLKAFDIGTLAVSGISAGYSAYKLYKYYDSAQFLAH